MVLLQGRYILRIAGDLRNGHLTLFRSISRIG
jgi:hypothetical protein